ncbi:MAG: YbaB/EbfC family nucleoid-associated protein [Spirochaetes bacterium]|nr:YbaB/EbfC family nucleoid-associated protein [Spirochaetota bacterium]
MLKGLGDIGNIMRLQREFKNLQKKLKKMEATGETADGLVKVSVSGEYRVVDVVIADELISSGDKRKLEKSIAFACNVAIDKMKELAAKEMSNLTGGLNIPGLTDFFK